MSNALAAQPSSVLREGNWYKMAFDRGGVCKIDANLLRNIGIDPTAHTPATLKVFGHRGGMLPQSNDAPRIQDLESIPLYWKTGSSTDAWTANTQAFFYVDEPHPWKFDTIARTFRHELNLYSDTVYYFLTFADHVSPSVMPVAPDLQTPQTNFRNTYLRLQFHERELYNVLESGRQWYGELFDGQNPVRVSFASDYLQPQLPVQLRAAVMVQPKIAGTTMFTFQLDNQPIGTIVANNSGDCRFCFVGREWIQTFTVQTGTPTDLNVSIRYERGADAGGRAYLNFLELYSHHEAVYDGSTMYIQQPSDRIVPTPGLSIRLVRNSGVQIWDITDPVRVKRQHFEIVNGFARFGYENTVGNRRFLIFDENNGTYVKPVFSKKILNQNLRSVSDLDLLIITHPRLVPQADRLAQRRNQEGIRTAVFTTEPIYNEFSGGKQDVTAIRDFIKHIYDTNTGLKNVLLFGACSYDYKNRITNNTNLVPTYQSRESLHDIYSYNSEDFFTFLTSGTGEWVESETGNHRMDVGIGRIPVASVEEARIVVDKLFHYKSTASLGKWRNRILFTADNGDFNIHLRDADAVAEKVDSTLPHFNIQKIYISATPLVSTPSGNRAEAATARMLEELRKGVLLFNYSGHGGVEVLAQETLLDVSMIMALNNLDRLPFFITATCDFGAYDNPRRFSGAKAILLNPKGGGIGLITAVRPVFTNTNYALNLNFYRNLLQIQPDGNVPDLGTVFKNTKNASISRSNRAYALIGDPSMTLNFPTKDIEIEQVLDGRTGHATDTIRALSVVSVVGKIVFPNGQTDTTFRGFVDVELYDKRNTFSTLEQENTPATTFEQRNSILYAGVSRVQKGRFTSAFVVPKNINYNLGAGKMSIYAYDVTTNTDAWGQNSQFKIGLTDPNAPSDNTPPRVRLFIHDTTFVNGQQIQPDATLLAFLYDENGISISRASVGQDIRATLNQNSNTVWILNDYYMTDIDTYQSGTIIFPLKNLPAGRHTLQLRAWDTYNNSGDAEIEFVVMPADAFSIEKLWAYPNPAIRSTTIQALHSRGGEPLDVTLEIFDSKGALVHKYTGYTDASFTQIHVNFDWISENKYTMHPGLYVYRLTLHSKKDNKQASATQRLVLTH